MSSSLQGALLVIVPLLLVGAANYWYWFVRDGAAPTPPPPEPVQSMTAADVAAIEAELGVRLPLAYVRFVQAARDDTIDATSVSDNPAHVVEMTRAYRDGEFGGKPWPPHLVFIGDEADACPRVLDCESGVVVRVGKGDLSTRPIERYEDFGRFVGSRLAG